jgi:3',5'-cyclic AMP phosphodiesterase CpdA
MGRFTFAVIADSHFHPPGVPEQAAWFEDRFFNDRNRSVVDLIAAARPAFVVHLGDVPHPVPGLQAHERALDVAQAVYEKLGAPLYMVAGNHDIGDKPNPLSPVPRRDDAALDGFRARWGPLWRRIDHEGWSFLLINTPLLNSGHTLEREQAAWLDQELASLAGRRWMAFVHYPPYLLHEREGEHYDNVAEPGRSWLLQRLSGASHVFCGHVHHTFWHLRGGQDLWIAPSTAFVRPGYSELARVSPSGAFGRDDVDKLGFFFVHVDGDRAEVEHVRSSAAPADGALAPGIGAPPPCPLGFTLRHPWDEVLDIPADGLDPFQRKSARNDLTLVALRELGAHWLRLPRADLARPDSRARLQGLHDRGWRFIFYGVGEPDGHDPLAFAHEVIGGAPGAGRWVSAVSKAAVRDGERFSHFPALGYPLDATLPEGAVVRIPAEIWPGDAPDVGVMGLVEMPRGAESGCFDDDAVVACRAAEALLMAASGRRLFLDAFVDHDRGYFPRNGLIDRRGGPRAGHRVVAHLNRLLGGAVAPEADHVDGARRWWVGDSALWLPISEVSMPNGVDLVTGRRVDGPSRWPRWVE